MRHPPPPPGSDENLLVASVADPGAFAALYDRHASGLLCWLRRQSDPDTARDLLAETWAAAWVARGRFRPEKGAAKAWLYGIARHQVLHFYRRLAVERRGRDRLGLEPAFATDATADADVRLDAQARRIELERLLGALTPAVREAVILRAVDQLGYDEIATRTRSSPQAARLRVSRGLRALRKAWATDSEPPAAVVTEIPRLSKAS